MYAVHSLARNPLLLLSPFFLFARARGCSDQDQAISKSYYTSSLSSLLPREDFMVELCSIWQWLLCQRAHQKPVGRGADRVDTRRIPSRNVPGKKKRKKTRKRKPRFRCVAIPAAGGLAAPSLHLTLIQISISSVGGSQIAEVRRSFSSRSTL
jgi:hypothetical protein